MVYGCVVNGRMLSPDRFARHSGSDRKAWVENDGDYDSRQRVMLSNSLHRTVQHYTFLFPQQFYVAGDVKDSSSWSLLRRQHQFFDALLDFLFCQFGIADQYFAEILAFLAKELSYLLICEAGQFRCWFRSQQPINFC